MLCICLCTKQAPCFLSPVNAMQNEIFQPGHQLQQAVVDIFTSMKSVCWLLLEMLIVILKYYV